MGGREDFGHLRMTRIYRYILTHDSGMIPCPDDGMITLATCKPVIRRMARPGDWVVGFRPGSLVRGLVPWAGKVEQVVNHGDYQRTHPARSDAVYRLAENEQFERLAPDYHASQAELERDTGGPVLLFDPGWSFYFNGRPEPLPDDLFHLAAAGRGHRVTEATPDMRERFEAWLAGLGVQAGPSNERTAAKSRRRC